MEQTTNIDFPLKSELKIVKRIWISVTQSASTSSFHHDQETCKGGWGFDEGLNEVKCSDLITQV